MRFKEFDDWITTSPHKKLCLPSSSQTVLLVIRHNINTTFSRITKPKGIPRGAELIK